jgi:hypothetical protein
MFVRMNTRPVVAMAMFLLAALLIGASLVYADAAPKWTDAELVGARDERRVRPAAGGTEMLVTDLARRRRR